MVELKPWGESRRRELRGADGMHEGRTSALPLCVTGEFWKMKALWVDPEVVTTQVTKIHEVRKLCKLLGWNFYSLVVPLLSSMHEVSWWGSFLLHQKTCCFRIIQGLCRIMGSEIVSHPCRSYVEGFTVSWSPAPCYLPGSQSHNQRDWQALPGKGQKATIFRFVGPMVP